MCPSGRVLYSGQRDGQRTVSWIDVTIEVEYERGDMCDGLQKQRQTAAFSQVEVVLSGTTSWRN